MCSVTRFHPDSLDELIQCCPSPPNWIKGRRDRGEGGERGDEGKGKYHPMTEVH